jgi:hypothetical protein
MFGKLILVSALVQLASTTPVAQNNVVTSSQKPIRVEKPKNFYIEPDLDTKRPYTADAKFSVVRYG